MIDYKYSDLFLQSGTKYNLIIDCDGSRLDNSNLKGAWELTERLTENKLQIGQCVPDKIVLKMVNNGTSYADKEMNISLVIINHEDEPFQIGKFRCYSETLENDRRSRNITAYDGLYEIVNADVKEWVDSLTFPMTVKQLRDLFFSYFGMEQEDIELPNDDFMILKKPEDDKISGKKIIESICQANGCFGHVGRDGIFYYVFLIQSLVPSEELVPSDDLVPGMDLEPDVRTRTYKSLKYEDYQVKEITGVRILVEENAEGVQIGEADNVFTVSDNFIFYGQSRENLEAMAENLLDVVSDIVFTPMELEMKANFCLELGDRIEALHRNGTRVSSYVINRTIRGVQAFMDKISSNADEKQENKVNSLQQKVADTQAQGVANTRRIGTVEEDNLVIHGEIRGQRADIDEIKTKKLDADQLSAEVAKLGYATIGQLDAQKARIDDLQSKSVTTENLSSKISALGSVNIGQVYCSEYHVTYDGRDIPLRPMRIGNQIFLAFDVPSGQSL